MDDDDDDDFFGRNPATLDDLDSELTDIKNNIHYLRSDLKEFSEKSRELNGYSLSSITDLLLSINNNIATAANLLLFICVMICVIFGFIFIKL
ncbi:MAG: hypothetical protein V4629_03260 [Pseudomonadota bacterium]